MKTNDNREPNLSDVFADDTLQELELQNILQPEQANVSDSELLEQDFIRQHPYPRPLLNKQLEFYSSREERRQLAGPRLADLSGKKARQKQMRIIILIDIILFIVILGVIYPSLRKIQTSGKINGYRFSLKKSFDNRAKLVNVISKIETLAANGQNTSFTIIINWQGQMLLREQGLLPTANSPISYALFSIPYKKLQNGSKISLENSKVAGENKNGLDIVIQMDRAQKKFLLPLPRFLPESVQFIP